MICPSADEERERDTHTHTHTHTHEYYPGIKKNVLVRWNLLHRVK